jgi:hypothetical protein
MSLDSKLNALLCFSWYAILTVLYATLLLKPLRSANCRVYSTTPCKFGLLTFLYQQNHVTFGLSVLVKYQAVLAASCGVLITMKVVSPLMCFATFRTTAEYF